MAATAQDLRGREIDIGPIERLLVRVTEEFRPIEIRLFGSRARGDSAVDSDWDLFVVVPDDVEAVDDLLAGYRLRRETATRADVILCAESEFVEDRDTPNTLAYEAAHFGTVIHER
jgi:predicted nucleotidyltransferase